MTCHVNVDCDGYAIEMHAAETSNLSGKGIQGVMGETKVLRSKKSREINVLKMENELNNLQLFVYFIKTYLKIFFKRYFLDN